ncbi:MAG: type II toxin-antitoxin system RelB/DinJ family antitoxin [Clostridiales Family XIII bacterium]|jgi:DNA-damage-inducible protein J|nr:type II toxin-antitoxin system RelB/DinJ family antitoxin [Clostridiales Family XIII bacterium]
MAKNATVNLRVDSEVKKQAGEILESMGLTLSEAFNLMLHQINIQRALPFDVVSYSRCPNRETLALIERIESGNADMQGPFETLGAVKA